MNNFILNDIHDPTYSYGILILPIFKTDLYGNLKWLAYFKTYGFKLTSKFGFHNCSKTGIY